MRSLTVIPQPADRFEAARAADAYRRAETLGRRRSTAASPAPRPDPSVSPEGRGLGDFSILAIGAVVAVMLGLLLGGALAV